MSAHRDDIIKRAESEYVDSDALLNAYIKRTENQKTELAKLHAKIRRLEPSLEEALTFMEKHGFAATAKRMRERGFSKAHAEVVGSVTDSEDVPR